MTSLYHEFKPTISKHAHIDGRNVEIGAFTVIEDYVVIDATDNIYSHVSIGVRSKIKTGSILRSYDGWIKIGNRVTIGPYCFIGGHGGVNIDDCSMIAGMCYISAASHIYTLGEAMRFQGEEARGIYIGRDVWLGANVILLDGVSIGDGCIVGAGSVVTRDMPSKTVCYGQPCRPIKKRHG